MGKLQHIFMFWRHLFNEIKDFDDGLYDFGDVHDLTFFDSRHPWRRKMQNRQPYVFARKNMKK